MSNKITVNRNQTDNVMKLFVSNKAPTFQSLNLNSKTKL